MRVNPPVIPERTRRVGIQHHEIVPLCKAVEVKKLSHRGAASLSSMENDYDGPFLPGRLSRWDEELVGALTATDMQGAADQPAFLSPGTGSSERYRGHCSVDNETDNKTSHMSILRVETDTAFHYPRASIFFHDINKGVDATRTFHAHFVKHLNRPGGPVKIDAFCR